MAVIRNTFMLVSILVFATSCATVQEKKALYDWNEESRKWTRSDTEDVNLPELDESARLDDYIL